MTLYEITDCEKTSTKTILDLIRNSDDKIMKPLMWLKPQKI